MLFIKQIHATTRPDSVASLESGTAAIDAVTIMAIRLGGACLEVLYANDGELLKQYCVGTMNKLNVEVLEVRDSHRQIWHSPPHSHTHPHTRTRLPMTRRGRVVGTVQVAVFPILGNHRAEL